MPWWVDDVACLDVERNYVVGASYLDREDSAKALKWLLLHPPGNK
jgi:hypothetical protein